jgi:hypothetical protein
MQSPFNGFFILIKIQGGTDTSPLKWKRIGMLFILTQAMKIK